VKVLRFRYTAWCELDLPLLTTGGKFTIGPISEYGKTILVENLPPRVSLSVMWARYKSSHMSRLHPSLSLIVLGGIGNSISKKSSKKTGKSSSKLSADRGKFQVSMGSPRLHLLLPQRFITSVSTNLNAYIAAGAATAAAGNYASIMVNSLTSPFNTPTYPMTATTATATYAFAGSLVQGGHIYDSPIGTAGVLSLWQNYKVLSYRLKVTVMPVASADVCECVILPIGNEEIPSAAAGSTDLRVLCAQPRAINKICETNVPFRSNTLILEGHVHNLLGLTKAQWMALPSVPVGSQPPSVGTTMSQRAFCGFFLQELNGGNNQSIMTARFELEQTVELSDLIQQIT